MSKFRDEYANAFFEDEGLELALRVGKALKAGAETLDISFSEQVLPMAYQNTKDGLGTFYYGSGLSHHSGKAEKLLEKYPEDAEKIKEYADKFDSYKYLSDIPRLSKEGWQLFEARAMWGGEWGGHSNPDFGRIINLGTDGIREIIKQGREKNKVDTDWFYDGCECVLDALDILGERFRLLALEEKEKCEDPVKRARYEEAARAFRVVPKSPAYDFSSACYAFWLIFTYDGVDSPGRFDQYMQRAYEITEDRAAVADMLERVWEMFYSNRAWNLCLSGSDENWNDDTNELTYDILKIAAEKKYNTPNITLRVHRNTPERLWNAIAETLASGIGMPALYNDEVVCPALESLGIPAVHSHLYCMNGCNQIDIMGKSHMGLEDGEVIFGKCLEYALHNGLNAMTGERDSIKTGDPRKFKTYKELEDAFIAQLDYVTYMTCLNANAYQQMRATYSPNPLRSCLIEGCLERGIDYRNGGPLYNHGQILAEAIADAGDSLWAVKKLVFDEGKYTMDQLIDALCDNFEGHDELRRDFSTCEKFGNDSDGVDEITARILNRFFTFLKRQHTYRGGVFTGGCSPFNRAAGYGRRLAALPNGRLKGDPIIADCIGAVPGCDVNGPTALINSVLRYNHCDSCSGFIFHVKFDKKLFNTDKGKQSFIALAKAYFAAGGQQYTVSVVSHEELLDAQIHPEKHRDLIVRVGGFSDYFINLDRGLQSNVIARSFTEV